MRVISFTLEQFQGEIQSRIADAEGMQQIWNNQYGNRLTGEPTDQVVYLDWQTKHQVAYALVHDNLVVLSLLCQAVYNDDTCKAKNDWKEELDPRGISYRKHFIQEVQRFIKRDLKRYRHDL